jgi:hypothetical protein
MGLYIYIKVLSYQSKLNKGKIMKFNNFFHIHIDAPFFFERSIYIHNYFSSMTSKKSILTCQIDQRLYVNVENKR